MTFVLIVGPAGDTRSALARALREAGFDVTEAESADTVAAEPGTVVVAAGAGAAQLLDALRGDSVLTSLRAKNAELETFASRASHDLKTPLAVIAGTADTLTKGWDRLREEDRRQLLDAMWNQATKAATMVNDLLVLARSGSAGATPRVDDVRRVVDDAVNRLPLRPDDEVTVDERWPPLAVARSDLTSILTNLTDNAHHYGRGDDGVLRLRLACATDSDGDAVTITVDDAGTGVPEEVRPLLFRPDGRVEGSELRNPNSTGMGLAIVHRCAERSGGSTGVDTSPDGGARFWVTLPVAR